MMDLERLAQANIPCPRCHAEPHADCRTTSGNHSPRLHSARSEVLYRVWRLGYSEGRGDAEHRGQRP